MMNNNRIVKYIGLVFFATFVFLGCVETKTIREYQVIDLNDHKNESEYTVTGWVNSKTYWEPNKTELKVTLYMLYESQYLKIHSQDFQKINLPFKYSFVLVPLQLGEKKFKMTVNLKQNNEIKVEKVRYFSLEDVKKGNIDIQI